jgi:hypothetical protein
MPHTRKRTTRTTGRTDTWTRSGPRPRDRSLRRRPPRPSSTVSRPWCRRSPLPRSIRPSTGPPRPQAALAEGVPLREILAALVSLTAPAAPEAPPAPPWAHRLPLSLDAFAETGAALGIRFPALGVSTWWTGLEAQAHRVAAERRLSVREVWQRDRLQQEARQAGLDPETVTVITGEYDRRFPRVSWFSGCSHNRPFRCVLLRAPHSTVFHRFHRRFGWFCWMLAGWNRVACPDDERVLASVVRSRRSALTCSGAWPGTHNAYPRGAVAPPT